MRRTATAGCLLLPLTGGCSTGPDYEPPALELRERFHAAGDPAGDAAPPPPVDAWWESFADPVLVACVEECAATRRLAALTCPGV